jgi:sulfatase modifying factor 1
MTRRRKVVFALLAMGLAVFFSLGVLLAADIYVHRKFQTSGGVNIWGYRGPTVGKKQPGERRLVVVGGSSAFGYGVRWHEAFPAVLEHLLSQGEGAAPPSRVSVVNLAYNNEGAHSFRYTLADYEYLDYDVALIYTGYNDLAYFQNFETSNLNVERRASALFRGTGYFPMLPLVMREKAMAIRYNGRLEDAYQGKASVFKPGLAQGSTAAVLEAAAKLSTSLDRYTPDGKRSDTDVRDGKVYLPDTAAVQCGTYTGYCGQLYLAVKLLMDRGKRALVVTQPYISERHREQQFLMTEYLRKRFAGSTRLGFFNLGTTLNLRDPAIAFDGMHLTVAGNRVIAQALVPGVRASLGDESVGLTAPAVSAAAPAPPGPVMAVVDGARPAAAGPSPGAMRISPVDERAMSWIPPGTFQMGSPTKETGRDDGETPHQVTIGSGFWMDTTEVTNAAYLRFVQAQTEWSNARLQSDQYDGTYLREWKHELPPPGKGEYPVTAVTWFAARAYCSWAGKRLPTEAEWEYAARAGTTTAYWWGDGFDGAKANRNGRATEPVAKVSRVNPWGLADMAGNVWEWTSSWHQPYPYRADDGRESADRGGDGRRVLRGGSWVIDPPYLRSADRFKYNPRITSDYVGFRCAQTAQWVP